MELTFGAVRFSVEAEIKLASRYSSSLAILLLNLDHIKKVNDAYGHDVGDLVLLRTTEAINAALRKHDLARQVSSAKNLQYA